MAGSSEVLGYRVTDGAIIAIVAGIVAILLLVAYEINSAAGAASSDISTIGSNVWGWLDACDVITGFGNWVSGNGFTCNPSSGSGAPSGSTVTAGGTTSGEGGGF